MDLNLTKLYEALSAYRKLIYNFKKIIFWTKGTKWNSKVTDKIF